MSYEYQLHDDEQVFEELFNQLKDVHGDRVKTGWPGITYSADENGELIRRMTGQGLDVETYVIELGKYKAYVDKIKYKKKYSNYYSFNFPEKTLEYFLAYNLIALKKNDVFVDIAAEHSPHYKEFSKLSGAKGYRQDLMYKKGVRGRDIGGDAAEMPVEDDFFNSAFAVCSLEHFENDSDIKFIEEMGRVLKPGGRLVILPLYIHFDPFVVTDPRYSIPGNVRFDEGIDIHCVDTYRNRHGRFYSPETLKERLIAPHMEMFDFKVYNFENFRDIHDSVYCRFGLEGIRKG